MEHQAEAELPLCNIKEKQNCKIASSEIYVYLHRRPPPGQPVTTARFFLSTRVIPNLAILRELILCITPFHSIFYLKIAKVNGFIRNVSLCDKKEWLESLVLLLIWSNPFQANNPVAHAAVSPLPPSPPRPSTPPHPTSHFWDFFLHSSALLSFLGY